MIYYKRCTGKLLPQKTTEQPSWVQWTHHSEGKTHCEECLILDGCFFTQSNHPPCPHHPYCHCTLDPVPYAVVFGNISVYSDYGKFDPYLFKTTGLQTHNKEKLFKEWGYTVEDAKWLQAEIERQGRKRYLSGQYELGKLNMFGQRINIKVTIPKKDGSGDVSFVTGWMVKPNGQIRLNTPYGGK